MVVHKYLLSQGGPCEVVMPAGAKPLSVGWQNDRLYLWVLVDTNRADTPYRFLIEATGVPLDRHKNLVFIGTAHTVFVDATSMRSCPFVLHIFQLPE